ncbi:hypothetical protein [Flavobacterium sp. CAU 1735]|uniref:hypothetical protein n=1 Tax=Flavobacterium sp. CAU 1735 TaxID=3140361 RepID=UPI00325FF7A9
MKSRLFVVVFLFASLINSSCKDNCNNELAVEEFKKDLQTVAYSIKNTNINLKELPLVIQKIEKVSSIESESDSNYLGKFHPTSSDVMKWTNWFENNKEKLCLDNKNNIYYLKE